MSPIFRRVTSYSSVLLLVTAMGCAGSGDPSDPAGAEDAGNILSETIDDTSGGGAGSACGQTVYPNPIGLPSSTLDVTGSSFSITNIATDHPLVTNNNDGHHDDTVFTTDAVVPNPGDTATHSYFVDWSIQTVSVDSCRPTGAVLTSRAEVRFPDGTASSDERLEDFEGFPAGTLVSNQYDGFVVRCENATSGHPDACILFDSENPTGDDGDLATDDQGMVLIIAENLKDGGADETHDDHHGPSHHRHEDHGHHGKPAEDTDRSKDGKDHHDHGIHGDDHHDHGNHGDKDDDENPADGLVDDPDDEANGGTIEFAFDQPASVNGIGLLDLDMAETSAQLTFTKSDGTTSTVSVAAAGDGVGFSVALTESDVVSMTLTLPGSGAVTSLDYAFVTEVPGDGDGTTILSAVWDATDDNGVTVPDGGYLFNATATLVRGDGLVMETLSSDFVGLLVDSSPVDFDQQPHLRGCDAGVDADGCECATGESDCTYTNVSSLSTWANVPTSIAPFMTTTQDATTGRYHVVVDLTEYNGGGLIPQGSGMWASGDALKVYITALTGVPATDDERLFNFDFTQVGVSTGITDTGFAAESFNNVLLDLITDKSGMINVGGETTDLRLALNSTAGAPAGYQIPNSRVDNECTVSGGFNGTQSMTSKYCVYAEAIVLESSTNIGIYSFRSSTFDPKIDDASLTRDISCSTGGCAVRTREVASVMTVDSVFYTDVAGVPTEAFVDQAAYTGSGMSRLIDRGPLGSVLSGQCSRSVAESGNIRARMDSADGAVGENCVINGIFE